jgi:4-amino-4-deoxy-L-arabinose transferase-like glycosyltransferase
LALWTALILVAATAFRLWAAWFRQLVPDEAYYWVWSRHLALSYIDHPPMVAYLIKLSTALLGSTELGVRLPAVLLSTGILIVLLAIARRLPIAPLPRFLMVLTLLASPLFSAWSLLTTPDTPSCFFSTCALACA